VYKFNVLYRERKLVTKRQ